METGYLLIWTRVSILEIYPLLPARLQPFPLKLIPDPSTDAHDLLVVALVEFEVQNGHDPVFSLSWVNHPSRVVHLKLTLGRAPHPRRVFVFAARVGFAAKTKTR